MFPRLPRTASRIAFRIASRTASRTASRRASRTASRRAAALLLVALGIAFRPLAAHGSVALLMEEPYGEFGAFNPTGHAAVYLNHICAVSPTRLRPCQPGELGAVLSRYHKIHHEDWIAIPLVPYLYAVSDIRDVPASVNKADVERLRTAWWAAHLRELVPATANGTPPNGEWTQLVGSSFDRKIHGFQADTTTDQDERLMAYFNDRRNVGHFNLFFHNCADFSKTVLDIYFPHAIHRNWIADFGLTTPKQLAKSLVHYGHQNPQVHLTAFTILQVPGTLPRSHAVDGVAESLVRSKKYIIPLVVLAPEFAGGVAVGYLARGRLTLPRDAPVFQIGDDAPSAAQFADTARGMATPNRDNTTAPASTSTPSGAPSLAPGPAN